MVNPISSQPQRATHACATCSRHHHIAPLCVRSAPRLLLVLLIAMGALSGCARKPIVSLFTASPTPTTLLPAQVAVGIVGAMTTITPPSPTAAPTAPPQPLSGFAQPQTPAPPAPLIGVAVPVAPAVAADLIAAGSAYQYAGACAEAIPLYEQAISADPGFSNVYALLALCLYDQDRIDDAVPRWREALQRDPQSPDALAGLGTALYRQGEQASGLDLYRQAVAVDMRYADETFLRTDSLWGGPALFDSRALRAQLVP